MTVPSELERTKAELDGAYDQLRQAGARARELNRQIRDSAEDRKKLAVALTACLEAGLPADVAEQARDALGGLDE